ncbi:MAG: hypothetical protein EOO48_10635 [Flavobacterium sp.]|nr:MAG: hypothetical protein EOO48_10635 [Flavobacterium sp.]
MKDILKPLESIREVDPPYFLRGKIMAKIQAVEERVTPAVVAWGSFALAVLFLASVYTVTKVKTRQSGLAGELIENNNLY